MKLQKQSFVMKKYVFGRYMSFFGVTRTPVLDFWWHLPWGSNPEWVLPYSLFCGGKYNVLVPLVLDFSWRLLWGSNAKWVLPYSIFAATRAEGRTDTKYWLIQLASLRKLSHLSHPKTVIMSYQKKKKKKIQQSQQFLQLTSPNHTGQSQAWPH